MQACSSDSRSSRVFVVDDEWMIAQSLAALLDKHGFRSEAFHNPGHALVRAMEWPPDVLISDVMMPGMTGVELAVTLRQAGVDSRILLVSGQTDAAKMVGAARRKGFDFELLSKPLNPMRLLMRLRHPRRRERSRPRILTEAPRTPEFVAEALPRTA